MLGVSFSDRLFEDEVISNGVGWDAGILFFS